MAETILGPGSVRVSRDVEFAELWITDGHALILISPEVANDPPRMRIAIARELAEWEMRDAPYSADLEQECCQIAAAIAMPYAATKKLIDDAGRFAPYLLAEHFEVPLEEVYDRCARLFEPSSGTFLATTRLFSVAPPKASVA